ncbi:MAG: 5'-methylthioadenosine phosphorylase [Gammaproteobacteria bacterium]|nr:MAG: 5'-methylthioadenosine phosphorylase [Gammaproteobacteria bacterium]
MNQDTEVQVAVIGGSGLTALDSFLEVATHQVDTPYGATSAPIVEGILADKRIYFLARHGSNHTLAPHKINYRANLWALHQLGVRQIVSTNAVGGITAGYDAQAIVVPDQLIDYTYKREHSFCGDESFNIPHIDFTHPFCNVLRGRIINAANSLDLDIVASGVYGCTEGPRLESAAEIVRLERDGCDLVGMTCMPEASLARELDMSYASICLVVNKAAGKSDELISMKEIEAILNDSMSKVFELLQAIVPTLAHYK